MILANYDSGFMIRDYPPRRMLPTAVVIRVFWFTLKLQIRNYKLSIPNEESFRYSGMQPFNRFIKVPKHFKRLFRTIDFVVKICNNFLA